MAKLGGTLNAICAKLLKNNNNSEPKTSPNSYLNLHSQGSSSCNSPHQHDDEGEESARRDDTSRDVCLGYGTNEVDTCDNNNEPLKEAVVDLSNKLDNNSMGNESDDSFQHSHWLSNGNSTNYGKMSDDETPDNTNISSTCSSPTFSNGEKHKSVSVVLTSTPMSGGRRNRRKNKMPRNIAHIAFKDVQDELVKEGLEDYEINNHDVDFSAVMEEEVLDLSSRSVSPRKSVELQEQDEACLVDSSSVTEMEQDGALDLSISRFHSNSDTTCSKTYVKEVNSRDTPTSKHDAQGISKQTTESASPGEHCDKLAKPLPAGRVLSSDIVTADLARRSHIEGTTADATVIKDYAQNTMNELLSMYGLGESEASDITRSVPLQNFSSGRILERHLVGGASSRTMSATPAIKLLMKTAQSVNSDIANKVSMASGNLVALPSQLTTASVTSMKLPVATSPSDSPVIAPSASTSESASNEGIYAKFVDSVNKLAQLPQGTMIGSPPVLLPIMPDAHRNIDALLRLASAVELQRAPPGITSAICDSSQNQSSPDSPGKAQTAKFAQSAEYIRACFNPTLAPKLASATSKNLLPDYSRYVRRYGTWEECGGNHCKDMAYREHFHCMDCSFRVFVKKEEMIRHFKWHKKREESLQHGFMRYSPMDNCVKKFGPCTHNGKQTHYHCLQKSCNKVYISTSDVQMHANYHRKDSAIIQEGFQRFRATEDCGTPECSFYGQRTTHFHCRRQTCQFTFKNKADMEKHKTYHQKDEILGKDGFKKFMKYENCSFPECRYSKVSNHIHCIRPGCDYVLHSTGQLFSHKRKHERRDFEHAYRRFKNEQRGKLPTRFGIPSSPNATQKSPGGSTDKPAVSTPSSVKQEAEYIDLEDLSMMSDDEQDLSSFATDLSSHQSLVSTPSTPISRLDFSHSSTPSLSGTPDLGDKSEFKSRPLPSTLAKLASKLSGSNLNDSLTLPIPSYEKDVKSEDAALSSQDDDQDLEIPVTSPAGFTPTTAFTPPVNEKRERDESWKKFLTRFTANDPCHPRCQFLYKDHYHCNTKSCGMLFRSKDGVREHARYHLQQDSISGLSYRSYGADEECLPGCELSHKTRHYHCLWADCSQVIKESDPAFSRLEHHKIHEFSRSVTNRQPRQFTMYKFHDMVKRRRGRPPKYPKTEIPVVPKFEMSEFQITREMEKCKDPMTATILASGFKHFVPPNSCPDEKCLYHLKDHFHCVRPRCHHATDRSDVLNLHAKDFHCYINILDGFEFFDRNVNCRRPHCHNNRANKHFHCVRPKCDYSFVRYSTMAQHDKKHKLAEMGKPIMSPVILPGAVAMVNSPVTIAIPGPPATMASTPQSAAALGKSIINLQNSPLLSSPLDKDKNVVKAAGTFYPLSGLTSSQHAPIVTVSSVSPIVTSVATLVPNTFGVQMVTPGVVQATSNAPVLFAPAPTSTPSTIPTPNLVNIAPKPAPTTTTVATSSGVMPLTMLLQQKQSNFNPQLNWLTLKMKMHFGISQNCGRPFCKLKKKDHYHCFECNQAFSDPIRLKTHVGKHGIKLDGSDAFGFHGDGSNGVNLDESSETGSMGNLSDDDDDEDDDIEGDESEDSGVDPSSSLSLSAATFSNLLQQSQHAPPLAVKLSSPGKEVENFRLGHSGSDALEMEEDENPIPAFCNGEDDDDSCHSLIIDESAGSPPSDVKEENSTLREENNMGRRSARKRTATRHTDFVNSDVALPKQRRQSSTRVSKEENLPDGFEKFRFCDDCEFARCAHRNMTHFHCMRKDCGYSFTDRTRITQHQQRHERLDNIMGNEFEQFRQTMDCERPDCEHSQKASHFHCLKCPYICTDSNKVLAHRKHHAKMDNITAQGFEKFVGTTDCKISDCTHQGKQTHYHCTVGMCHQAVLGPSQMNVHSMKHKESTG